MHSSPDLVRWLVAGPLIFLAVAHSVLGERLLLKPLFSANWKVDIGRRMAERILRFAWHLTSIAWVALALIAVGLPLWLVLGAHCLAAAALIFVTGRDHFAWPFFTLAALAALVADGRWGEPVLAVSGAAAAVALAVAALLHLYWAVGGTWGYLHVLPTRPTGKNSSRAKDLSREGEPLFLPSAWSCLAVGLALSVAATLVSAPLWTGRWPVEIPGLRWLLLAATLVFALRAIGERRWVGFTKTVRSTRFARLDDRIYTPLVVLFTFGALGAWWLTGS